MPLNLARRRVLTTRHSRDAQSGSTRVALLACAAFRVLLPLADIVVFLPLLRGEMPGYADKASWDAR